MIKVTGIYFILSSVHNLCIHFYKGNVEAFSRLYRRLEEEGEEGQSVEEIKSKEVFKADFYGKAKLEMHEAVMLGTLIREDSITLALRELDMIAFFFLYGLESKCPFIFVVLTSIELSDNILKYDLTPFPILRSADKDKRFYVIWQ